MNTVRSITLFQVLILVIFFFLVYSALPVSAQVTFRDNEAQFLTDNPGLAFQSFSAANVPVNNLVNCGNVPINSMSSDPCFMPGDILPGIEFTILNPSGEGNILVSGGKYSSNVNPPNVLSNNTYGDNVDILFTGTFVNRVGMVIGCMEVPGPCSENITIEVYGPGDVLTGSTDREVTSSFEMFLGVSSTATINRIRLVRTNPGVQYVEALLNIRFSEGSSPVVGTIPTLSEWGVVGAVAGLVLVGVFFVMRRRKGSCCGQ